MWTDDVFTTGSINRIPRNAGQLNKLLFIRQITNYK